MDFDFSALANTLVGEITTLLGSAFGNLIADAQADAQKFVDKNKDNLLRWAQLYASGKLTKKDLEALLRSSKNLFDMELLSQTGAALIAFDKFKADAINVIVNTISSVV
jgi:hypothetical protein